MAASRMLKLCCAEAQDTQYQPAAYRRVQNSQRNHLASFTISETDSILNFHFHLESCLLHRR
jgi:hypothetical protein